MNKQGCYLVLLLFSSMFLNACVSSIWTGANLIYTRHTVYKKFDDYKLAATANHVLFEDKIFKQKGVYLDVAVFNGDILLAGHLPTITLRNEAQRRLETLSGYRKLFQQVAIDTAVNNGMVDSWITTKIRSKIIADSQIDPSAFKIITSDRIVYIMGDVNPKEAIRVIDIAKRTDGVIRVVKLLKYYNLSKNPSSGE